MRPSGAHCSSILCLRQAGRYLWQYREIRAKHGLFERHVRIRNTAVKGDEESSNPPTILAKPFQPQQ
jgi:hypothetical protein